MYVKNSIFLLVCALLSTAFLTEAGDSPSPEVLKVPLTRQRTLPANFTYYNANEVLLELHNNHNWSYSAYMTIGTPPQQLRIEFDTGSSDLWVAGPPVCKVNPTYCKTHRTFNPETSTTYKPIGRKIQLPYGSEIIDIEIAKDDFIVNGLKIKDQYFGLSYKIENVISDSKYPDNKDGIFGLSFENLSQIHETTGQPSPLMNLVHQGQLPQPVFAFYLTRPLSENSGELVLGGVDPERYTGEFVFTDVTSNYAWEINIEGLTLGEKKISENFPAIVDSGTSLIAGPEQLIKPIRDTVFGPHDVRTSVPCAISDKLPNVTFTISGKPFILTPSDYVIKEYSNVTCVFGFYITKYQDMKDVILGNVFMRKFYTLFDLGKRRIGFANAKEEEEGKEKDSDENPDFNILSS